MNADKSEADVGPIITYTLFPNAFPTERKERADVPWHDLCSKIHDAPTYISKRHCPLISLAAYGDTLTENNCIRHAANVLRVHGIEIDYDGEQVSPEDGAARLAAAGLRSIVYTSPSHIDGAPRWRALLPLADAGLPSLRVIYVARANRALGGIATRESFTLSQSFYVGKVRGGTYRVIETEGRCIDEAADLEPLYYVGHSAGPSPGQPGAGPRDSRTDEQLRQAFIAGDGRYEAMLKLSSRWAARGMPADDIAGALFGLLDQCRTSLNADGIDLRSRIEPLAYSAARKFGESRKRESPAPDPADYLPPEIDDPEPDRELPPIEDEAGQGEQTAAEHPVSFRHVAEIVAEQREPEWLLDDVIEANVLAVLAGPRGTFKSFVALDWSMRAAAVGQPVVILSGEGAGLDRRVDAWIKTHGAGRGADEFPVYALERALNLNADLEVVNLKAAIERMAQSPAMVVVDTFSKFSAGLDENDNGEVSTYLARLSRSIREVFKTTVLLVAHSGHADQARPRGASALMANPDAEYILARPSPGAMSVSVTRERFKDSPALPPLWYDAQVVDLGRNDKRGQPVTSLALSTGAGAPITVKGVGKNQQAVLAALKAFHRIRPDTRFVTSIDMTEIFKGQAIPLKRKPEVLNWLVNAGILVPSIGGHTFDPSNL
jgi:hypothetical protein